MHPSHGIASFLGCGVRRATNPVSPWTWIGGLIRVLDGGTAWRTDLVEETLVYKFGLRSLRKEMLKNSVHDTFIGKKEDAKSARVSPRSSSQFDY